MSDLQTKLRVMQDQFNAFQLSVVARLSQMNTIYASSLNTSKDHRDQSASPNDVDQITNLIIFGVKEDKENKSIPKYMMFYIFWLVTKSILWTLRCGQSKTNFD